MNILLKVIILTSCMVLTSCAHQVRTTNQYMTNPNPEKEYFPTNGNALLIVERTQEVNLSAYNMVVWDVTKRLEPKLIGYLAASMKAAYEVPPGKYTLLLQMAATNNAMEMTVEADKTYYTKIATDWYGIVFLPVKEGQENSMTRKNISIPTEQLVQWGTDRERIENSLQVRIDKGIGKWKKMSSEEMVEHNITAKDGR